MFMVNSFFKLCAFFMSIRLRGKLSYRKKFPSEITEQLNKAVSN